LRYVKVNASDARHKGAIKYGSVELCAFFVKSFSCIIGYLHFLQEIILPTAGFSAVFCFSKLSLTGARAQTFYTTSS